MRNTTYALIALAFITMAVLAACSKVNTPQQGLPDNANPNSDVEAISADFGNDVTTLNTTAESDPGFNDTDLDLGLT